MCFSRLKLQFWILFMVTFIEIAADPVPFNITNKPTWQSSNYRSDKYLSSAANDGCYLRNLGSECCTHTDGKADPGWWSVDLEVEVIVNSVTVFNRVQHKDRLSRFSIYGSNTTHTFSADSVKCGTRFSTVDSSYEMVCDQPILARYVIIQKEDRRDNNNARILTLCEVEIEVCPDYTYGKECKSCGHCERPQCDLTTGRCFGRCTAGYGGQSCDTECNGNRYGVDCLPCSENCFKTKCDKFSDTMVCSEGCVAGKTGQDCAQDCLDKTYGRECTQCSARCRDSECKKDSEQLECTDGCEAGFTGNDCSEDCTGNTYGLGCLACSSRCKDSRCEKFSEALVCIGGCEAGYTGVDCAANCSVNTYGIGCKDCPSTCKQSVCDKFSETVHCTAGCIPGYTGVSCDTECPDGTYGYDCLPCSDHCQDASCDKFTENGACLGGCVPGYTLENCTEECPDNTYGSACEPCSAHCLTPPCDKFSLKGVCPGGCVSGYLGEDCLEAQVSDDKSSSNSGATVGAVIAVLLVVLIAAVVVVIFIRRRKQKKPRSHSDLNYGEDAANIYSGMNEEDVKVSVMQKPPISAKPKSLLDKNRNQESSNCSSHQVKPKMEPVNSAYVEEENLYANAGLENEPRASGTQILVRDFDRYMETLKTETKKLAVEYEDIPKTPCSYSDASVGELKSKNRYKNIMPYNHNRVTLQVHDGNPFSDYINASFIKDYHGKVSYIAALGSTKVTLNNTWQMIWEQEITSIFMVTNLIEFEKIKCDQYWPSSGQLTYGEVNVMLKEEIQGRHIVLRKLRVSKGGVSREVRHYHYVSWPDKQVPLSVTSVLTLRKHLKTERLTHTRPVLIHCSAGIGRTGTLIALDILLDQLDTEGAVDICKCVTDLRHQRTQMVQTLVQYKFLYECMYEVSTLGSTTLTDSDVNATVKGSQFTQRAGKEYQFLETVRPVFSEADTEMGRVYYTHKNRDKTIVPASDQRVKLSLLPEIYINAVYVRGYEGSQSFCATQWPLESTAVDFWRVILQEKSAAIVCMEKDIDASKWFSEKQVSLSYGDVNVIGVCTLDDGDSLVFDVCVQQGEADVDIQGKEVEYVNVSSLTESVVHRLKVIILKSWCRMDLSQRSLSLIPQMYHKVRKLLDVADKKVITVTCRNGCDETGLYIGASLLFEMIQKEKQVDVVQVVKQIRQNRPQFITDQEQYEWLYRVCAAYLSKTTSTA